MTEQASQSKSGTINISLANAGHTLGGAEVELVLKPLRLAFETKNLKIFDAALDCLHVCFFFLSYCIEYPWSFFPLKIFSLDYCNSVFM